MKVNTTLLTGGTGKLGLNIINGLISDGHVVVCCTRDRVEAEKKLGPLVSKIKFIEVNFFKENYWTVIQKFLSQNL
jgi:nucleoside-diphosphate-sugar epimerase